jgi:hypothetical protein
MATKSKTTKATSKIPLNVRDSLDRLYDTDVPTIKKGSRLTLGNMYLFAYPNPKWKQKLPWWDMLPLIILLGVHDGYVHGINVHHIPWSYRIKFVREVMERKAKRKRLLYKDIKRAWNAAKIPAAYAYLAYRTYIYDLIPTNFKMFDYEDWKPVTTKVLQSYAKGGGKNATSSDAQIYKEIQRRLNAQKKKVK